MDQHYLANQHHMRKRILKETQECTTRKMTDEEKKLYLDSKGKDGKNEKTQR